MNSKKRKMLIKDIVIPYWYSSPNPVKLSKCMDFYKKTGGLDRDIIVDSNGMLADGYIGYLTLKKYGVIETDVIVKHLGILEYDQISTIYVFGRHSSQTKEYVWRVTNNTKNTENLSPGNLALVCTKFGTKVITVTKVEILTTPPTELYIKKVLKCFET